MGSTERPGTEEPGTVAVGAAGVVGDSGMLTVMVTPEPQAEECISRNDTICWGWVDSHSDSVAATVQNKAPKARARILKPYILIEEMLLK